MSSWTHKETEGERAIRILEQWELARVKVNRAALYNSTLYRRRMTKFQTLIAKAKVLATAAVTYIVLAPLVVPIVVDELVKVLPSAQGIVVAAVAAKILSWIGAAIAIVRRVTPVLKEHRGLL